MAPKYKLTYFDTTGRAEQIRFIFAYLNQEYEDVRINSTEWPSIKPTTPFGKVPLLEIDDKIIPETNAISRYLARQFGLTGKDEWDSLQCDIMVDVLMDLLKLVYEWYYETDPKLKEERKQQKDKDVPFYLEKFEKIVADNPSGLLVGSEITWADLTFSAHMDIFQHGKPDLLEPYPNLDKLVNRIRSVPGVKAWLERRPPAPPPASIEV